MDISTSGSLNKADFLKWGRNLLIFLSPLILVYIGCVINALQQDGGVFSLRVFQITPLVQGALTLYLLNAITDLVKKYNAGSTP